MNLNELINQFQKIEKQVEIVNYLKARLEDKKQMSQLRSEHCFTDDDDVTEQREIALIEEIDAYEVIIRLEERILGNYLGSLIRVIEQGRIL